jgi:hypothetical protein
MTGFTREELALMFARSYPELGFIIDESGRYLEVFPLDGGTATQQSNPGMQFALGCKGCLLHDMVSEEFADWCMEVIHRVIETGEIEPIEYEIGGAMHEGCVAPVKGDYGEKRMVAWVTRHKR